MSAAPLPMRRCRHARLGIFRPTQCPECRAFLNALAERKQAIEEQTAAPPGGPSLRELRAENQQRLRAERDDAA